MSDAARRRSPDFGLYFFGDYPDQATAAQAYDTIVGAARFADQHGFSSLWLPERHFHSFGGIFPNPSVLAAALAKLTSRVRLNAGSVVLPLHDPIRVAEEWSVVDNLSGGRVGIGCATGWNANDFVLFPDRFGEHRATMYTLLAEVRRLWRGEPVERINGSGELVPVRLYPRPVQETPPMYVAVVGRRESFADAARHDLGIVTNLMTQDVDTLAANIAYYRETRAKHGLDPAAGTVAVLLHTYLGPDAAKAKEQAFQPLCSYLRASLSLFGQVANSLGFNIDLEKASEDDLTYLFERAYARYCDARALIGSPGSCAPIVAALREAGVDELAALVDFGVPAEQLLAGLPYLDKLRRQSQVVGRAAASPMPLSLLSPGQQRMWFLEQLMPGNNAQNEPKAIRLIGEIDHDALRAAMDDLVARHAALRTVYREVDGEPRQQAQPPCPADFAVLDRTGQPEEGVVRAAIAEESRRRFDLGTGPLFVARVLRLTGTHHVLVLSLHHIAVDALSATVLTRDLSELYSARLDGRPADLPALPALPGPDRRRATADLDYWVRQLDGELPVLRLPEDRPRPAVQTFNGRAMFSEIDAGLAAGLRRLSGTANTTLFMTLLGGLAATLHQCTGVDDLIVGVPISERPRGAEDLVGFFVNTLAMRFDLAGDPTFGELLGRVRNTALDAYDHAAVPFEDVVRAIAPERDTARTPVFQVMAEFKNAEAFRIEFPGVAATPLDAGREVAFTDLAFHLVNHGDRIGCHIEYNTDLFDPPTITRLVEYFHAVLGAAVADPERPLSRLTGGTGLVDADERALAGWQHGPETVVPDVTVPDLVAGWARDTPDAVAVTAGDRTLTYAELDTAADRLASRLVGAGVRRGDVVAVWLPRSTELVISLLAVLKAGAAYLPLDPSFGAQRVGAVLAHSRARLVLTAGDGTSTLPPLPAGIGVLAPDDERGAPAAADVVPATADDPCYVIYTSGSTGRPKGVVVSHRGVVNLCQWFHRRFGFTPVDRSAVVCGQSFDASVVELWPALTAGAALAVADEQVRLDPAALAAWYRQVRVTFTLLPTALGEAVLALPAAGQPPLTTMMIGGDVLRRRPPDGLPYEVVNAYGPTEATVLVSTHIVAPAGPAVIPIGQPINNVRLYVLDTFGRPAPVGVPGALYIGGPCVADGYLHAPGLTAEHFVPDPFCGAGERLYRTGDLARWIADGILEFRGRTDDQVKVRGFRVELGEASAVLRLLPGVADGVVLAQRDGHGDAYLAGYVVPHSGAGSASYLTEIADAMAKRLPEYLVPRAWSVLDNLPFDANGKLDRRALPTPEAIAADAGARPAIPPGSTGTGDVFAELRALWAGALNCPVEELTERSSFFDLGGHSITAMRLLNRVRDRYGISYPALEFYQRPTLGDMVGRLGGDQSDRADEADEQIVAEGPLSYQQEGVMAGVRRGTIGNVVLHVDLTGTLDLEALRTALEAVVERHESLRTRFVSRDGEWVQQVMRNRPFELALTDLRDAPANQRVLRRDELGRAAEGVDLDPAEGWLLRPELIRWSDTEWRLVLVTHHVVCDGWAASVLLHDLIEAYQLAHSGRTAALPPAGQSIGYARRQAREHDADVDTKNIEYWRERLTNTPLTITIPADHPQRSGQQVGTACFVRQAMPAGLDRAIERLARQRGSTPFAVCAAALVVLLAKLTGERTVALGAPHVARNSVDDESMVAIVGMVSLLHVDVDLDVRFESLIDTTTKSYFDGIDHFVPLATLFKELTSYRDDVPLFMPLSLVFQNATEVEYTLPDLTVTVEESPRLAGRARTSFFIEPRPSGWTIGAICNGDAYDRTSVQAWVQQYLDLLAEATAHPTSLVADLMG